MLRQRSFVPVPYQLIQQIELSDLMSVLLAIDELHVIIPDTELYAPGLSAISPHVDVSWPRTNWSNSNYHLQSWYSEIVNKYHFDLDPKMKDNSVCLTSLAKVFKHMVTSKQETDVRRNYFSEQLLCHNYVARVSENWCRHLVCRVIQ